MKTMKSLVMTMLMSILTVGMVSVFSACSDDLDLTADSESVNLEMEDEWVEPISHKAVCDKPVMFINSGRNVPGDLQQATTPVSPTRSEVSTMHKSSSSMAR